MPLIRKLTGVAAPLPLPAVLLWGGWVLFSRTSFLCFISATAVSSPQKVELHTENWEAVVLLGHAYTEVLRGFPLRFVQMEWGGFCEQRLLWPLGHLELGWRPGVALCSPMPSHCVPALGTTSPIPTCCKSSTHSHASQPSGPQLQEQHS